MTAVRDIANASRTCSTTRTSCCRWPSTPRYAALRLPDGRALAWAEYGSPRGLPCVLSRTSTPPASRPGWLLHDSALPGVHPAAHRRSARDRRVRPDRLRWLRESGRGPAPAGRDARRRPRGADRHRPGRGRRLRVRRPLPGDGGVRVGASRCGFRARRAAAHAGSPLAARPARAAALGRARSRRGSGPPGRTPT